MEYTGKLYGRIGNKHFDTGHTAKELDELTKQVETLKEQLNKEQKLPIDLVSESLKVGDDIIVCDDLITVVLRIEGDKIYFYDECKKEMWDIKEVIKPYSR